MNRLRFNLNSDQLELLLAFEQAKGLGHLAEVMAKDPSVVSRNLQRIAEEYPVLIKAKGRWTLTPLGLQLNQKSRIYIEDQEKLLKPSNKLNESKSSMFNGEPVLIIINTQNGLFDETQKNRNNSEAEENIARLQQIWRTKNRKIIHVKHVSNNPESIFYKHAAGCDFIDSLKPIENELILEKSKSSAFTDTKLIDYLNQESFTDIVLAGFTANECIDATAKDSTVFGFNTFVSSDATATFDLRDMTGKLVKAEKIHRLTLLNINAFSAKVLTTNEILSAL